AGRFSSFKARVEGIFLSPHYPAVVHADGVSLLHHRSIPVHKLFADELGLFQIPKSVKSMEASPPNFASTLGSFSSSMVSPCLKRVFKNQNRRVNI
ncbi:MAG: hypothetical protein J6S17_02825, partial [Aeriscardovia sp.]|nr:hypothetical protein [Aeriscardovia sp.]